MLNLSLGRRNGGRPWLGGRSQFASVIARLRVVLLAVGFTYLVASPFASFGQQRGRTWSSAAIARRREPLPQPVPPAEPAPEPPSEPLPDDIPRRGLSLDDLEQVAVMNNPSIARAAALVGAARGNWMQVGLRPNPTGGYEGQQLGSGGREEQHGVLFGQEFVRGGKLRLNRAVAGREQTRAQQELTAQRQRVLTDVRIAFYQVLVAQRQIDLTNSLVRVGRQGLESVEALVQAKEAGRAEILQAQLEVENSQILAQNARNRHEAAWRGLAVVIGDRGLPSQPLDGDALSPPKDFDFQETLEDLQTGSPEIAAALFEIDRARAALARARVEPIPNINFQGLVNWQDNGIGGKPDGGVAVTVPIPLFNRNQGAILKAQREVAAAQHALAQLELDLENRLATTFERYANARNQVERYKSKVLPAALESLDLTRQLYEAGEATYLGLLTAQRTYSQTHLNYLDAALMLRVAEAEIEGQLLRDSLQDR